MASNHTGRLVMKRHLLTTVLLVVWAVSAGLCHAQAPVVPDERAFWLVWVLNTNSTPDSAAVIAACKGFDAAVTNDPLSVVVRGLESWHLFKIGSTNEAMRLLDPLLKLPENPTPLQIAGAEIAKSWLTRLDREMVRIALKKLYLRDIEFPASLETIKTLKIKRMPPFTDRWGKPWVYKLRDDLGKGLGNQLYTLQSSQLGSGSDLGKALALPYAGRITLQPLRVMPGVGANEMIEFSSPSQKSILLSVGGSMDGTVVAYIGKNIIILSDGNHWRAIVKPR